MTLIKIIQIKYKKTQINKDLKSVTIMYSSEYKATLVIAINVRKGTCTYL